jgi:cytochrome c oxidase subunit 2
MALAIVLILMVVGSVAFHFWSPWWFTPLASNWGAMDSTIMITFWVTGFVFIAVNLFIAYCVIKFRHSPGRKAAYEPENNKLESWLTGLTSLGVFAMLAPGLMVYNEFVHVPEDAVIFEALGQQWQWSYRLPGEDGALGKADNRNVTFDNPMGVDPEDPWGQDDLIITGAPGHILLDQPVKFNLRSKDVLHDFYVPQFRAKMDVVPGLVSYFWLTPTMVGTFEAMCAELCGVGHYNMRSHIVVDTEADYKVWLSQQRTFAETQGKPAPGADPAAPAPAEVSPAERGEQLAQQRGCLACHSIDGTRGVGPSWKGMFGRVETLADGSTVTAADEYLRESITDPAAKLVEGYPPVMSAYPFSEDDLDALLAYFISLTE